MMNRNEFDQYVVDNVKQYLPPSFGSAGIELRTVTKANDVTLTGLCIRREDEQMVPNIYLEPYFERYRDGDPIDRIVGDIADMRIETDRSDRPYDVQKLLNYEEIKGDLQIRLCDAEQNTERLKDLVSIPDGDYAMTFQVCMGDVSGDSFGTVAVTQALLGSWGISARQLHDDAITAEDSRTPTLNRLSDVVASMMFGADEPVNYLGTAFPLIRDGDMMNIYVLSTQDKTFGASLIAREDILRKAATALGGNFFILPSSVHETLLVPESSAIDVQDLITMVREVNRSEVSPQDFLSDKVQHFDKDTGVRENALARQKRLELEKEKRPSIHEQLAEKKAAVRAKDAAYTDVPKKSRIAEASL